MKFLRNFAFALLAGMTLAGCSVNGPMHRHAATAGSFPEAVRRQVSVTFDGNGRLWRVTPGKSHVYVDYSDDKGHRFSAPVQIGSQSHRIKSSGENRPGIAVDGAGKIYVIFTAESDQPASVYFSVSADGGLSFGEPVPISNHAVEANTYLGKLRLDGKGQAYVFWHDERERNDWKAAGNTIYFSTIDRRSGRPAAASRAAEGLCECCGIAVAFDGKDRPVFVTRFLYEGGVRDHGLASRADDGTHWNTWRVTFDDWKIEACPEHGPALSIASDGRYHLAWFSQGNVRKGVYYAYSSDRGHQFSTPIPVGNPNALAGHPDLLVANNHVHLVWQEFDGSRNRILAMRSDDNGDHWSQPNLVADTADEADLPFLVTDGQKVFLSWNTQADGYRLITLP